jgi:O-antigen ligase
MNKALSDKKIMEYGIYLFIVVLFWGYTTYFKFLGLYIPAIFFFLRILLTKRVYRFWKCPLFIAIILYSISGILSTIWAVNTLESLVFFEKNVLRLILIYVIIVSVFDNKIRFSRLLHLLILTSFLYLFWSYRIYLHEFLSIGDIRRVLIENAAYPFVYLLPFLFLKTLFIKKNDYSKFFWMLTLPFAIVAVIFSGQRGAVLGIFGAICVWLVYVRNTTRFTIIVCIIICVSSVFMFAGDFSVIKEYESRGFASAGRRFLFEIYIDVFKDNYCLGLGLDDKAMIDAARGKGMVGPQGPHNSYLTIAVKQGIIGLISYISLILVSIFSLLWRIRGLPFTQYKAIGIALISCFVGMYIIEGLLHGMVMVPLAVLIGITGAYLNMKVRDYDCVVSTPNRL